MISCILFNNLPTDETLTSTTAPGQSGPGNNGYEGVLHISQISRTEALPTDAF